MRWATCAPEVLDDHLGLLGQRVLVQRHKLGDRRPGFARVEVGVVRRGVLDVPVGLVGDVAGQHVEDEPLLDRLTHRVQVKRDVLPKCPRSITPNSSSVRAFGVAVNAKNDRFGCLPRAAAAAASASSAGFGQLVRRRVPVADPSTSFSLVAESPVWLLWASSTITA
jgi:hypothetical protein